MAENTRDGWPEGKFDGTGNTNTLPATTDKTHALDGEDMRLLHSKLLSWYYTERDLQAENRSEMEIDAGFYDGLQWEPEDAAILRERGQMPLVYNEIAPMVDWMIGTERRTRLDWKILPRTEDDLKAADNKTAGLKYLSDANAMPFVQSQAFSEAMKAGLGWIDTGLRDDPTQEHIYVEYEDWRRVLHDSRGAQRLTLDDARYVFRWRRVDLDVAKIMFPHRAAQLERAADDMLALNDLDDDEPQGWGGPWDGYNNARQRIAGRASVSGVDANHTRRMVKLIECQYRIPVKTKIVASGPFQGTIAGPGDAILGEAIAADPTLTLIDKVMMRVHTAIFTEGDMIAHGLNAYRHNRFSLVPIWCYRRSKDRMPYGMVRRVRDIQQDMNKRASKAMFLLNSNQVVMDEFAVDDIDVLREEVAAPDGVIVKKAGKELVIRRDSEAANGQIEMMGLAAQSIQKSAGVAQENLGRQTNAISGEAIKARQNQGSVVTTEPFDNLRLAKQAIGQRVLSLMEQFMTEEKVLRITGAKDAIDWVKVNVLEVGPDGQVRVMNDITASIADFVVSEQDYAGTLRQVMFDSINGMAQKVTPDVGLRLLTIAMEFSDLPNKDEIANAFRRITGEADPNKRLTPEEQQQAAQQQQAQQEAMELQRQTAMATLAEAQAKARHINAQAAELEARVGTAPPTGNPEADQAMQGQMQESMKARAAAADTIDTLNERIGKLTADLTAARTQADSSVQVARINADAQERVAKIKAASDDILDALQERIDNALRAVNETIKAEADKRERGFAALNEKVTGAAKKPTADKP